MKKSILSVFALAAILVSCNEQKLAYVDTSKVIEEYKEMKDVEAEFTSKSDAVRNQLDSIGQAFQQEVQAYQSGMGSMSEAQRKAKEQELMQKQQMIQQRQQMQTNQLRQESSQIMDSLVEKVKTYVKDYGKDHGYSMVFGSNEGTTVMYAEDGMDITEEILKELNNGYEPKAGIEEPAEASEE